MKSIRIILMILSIWSASAHAARLAHVIVDEAEIREFPQKKAKSIGTLKKGEEVAVSNLPTEGFYKVRTKSGDLGWISGNDVFVAKKGASKDSSNQDSDQDSDKKSKDKDKDDETIHFKEDDDEADHEFHQPHSRVILGLGMQNPIYNGLGTYLVTSGINPGYGAELEFQFHWFSRVYWAMRAEYTFSKTASLALNDVNGTTQTMKHVGMPLQVGLVWSPFETKGFRFGIGAYAGIALLNSTNVTQTNSAQVLTVTYGSTDPVFTGVVQIGYGLGLNSSLFFEGGYRMEKTGLLPATTLENPTSVPPFIIDYSGPIGRIGLEFRF